MRFGNLAEGPDGLPLDEDMRVLELAKSNRARRGEQVHLIWDDGRFIKVAPGTVKNHAANAEAEQVFLQLLAKRNKQNRHVSPNRSRSYAPTEFAKDPRGREVGKARLEQAMNRLLDQEKIFVRMIGPPSRQMQRLDVGPHPPSTDDAGS
jgi:hypothetical protein